MGNRIKDIDSGLIVSGTALGATIILFAMVVSKAFITEALPVESQVTLDYSRPVSQQSNHEVLLPEEFRAAVNGAPFHPDRQAPSSRYRLPDDPVPPAPALPSPPPELPPAPGFKLLGTIAGGSVNEGAVVLLSVDDGPPQVLSLGDSYMGYTVAQVVGDRAMLSGQDRNLSLTVQGPAATVASNTNRTRNTGPVNTSNQGRNTTQQMQMQQIQQLLRGGPTNQVTPEQRQQLMRDAGGVAQDILQQLLRGGTQGGQWQQTGPTQRQVITRPGGG